MVKPVAVIESGNRRGLATSVAGRRKSSSKAANSVSFRGPGEMCLEHVRSGERSLGRRRWRREYAESANLE